MRHEMGHLTNRSRADANERRGAQALDSLMVLRPIQCLIAAITFAGLCNATAAERHITEGRNFNVIVETTNFDLKNHRMEYRTHEGQRALLKIDGAEY